MFYKILFIFAICYPTSILLPAMQKSPEQIERAKKRKRELNRQSAQRSRDRLKEKLSYASPVILTEKGEQLIHEIQNIIKILERNYSNTFELTIKNRLSSKISRLRKKIHLIKVGIPTTVNIQCYLQEIHFLHTYNTASAPRLLQELPSAQELLNLCEQSAYE